MVLRRKVSGSEILKVSGSEEKSQCSEIKKVSRSEIEKVSGSEEISQWF